MTSGANGAEQLNEMNEHLRQAANDIDNELTHTRENAME